MHIVNFALFPKIQDKNATFEKIFLNRKFFLFLKDTHKNNLKEERNLKAFRVPSLGGIVLGFYNQSPNVTAFHYNNL